MLLRRWVKSFGIFCNVRHNSAAQDAFALEVIKVIKTMLECEILSLLTWYNPNTTYCLGIRGFWPTRPLIIEVLSTRAKFLVPSNYCIVIDWTFIVCTTNVFGYFYSVMTQLELVKPLHYTFISASFKVKQYTICLHANYDNPTNHGLKCCGHMINRLQTSMYQNIAKLLIHLSNLFNHTDKKCYWLICFVQIRMDVVMPLVFVFFFKVREK